MASPQAPAELIFPASEKIELGSTNHWPEPWPPSVERVKGDPLLIAQELIDRLNRALRLRHNEAFTELFLAEGGYWKDHCCQTWQMTTLEGRDQIGDYLTGSDRDEGLQRVEMDTRNGWCVPQHVKFDPLDECKVLQAHLIVQTGLGMGRGLVRMTQIGDQWYIATLFTSLEQLTGHEERVRHRRDKGVEHGVLRDQLNWREKRDLAQRPGNVEPDVLIVGAGQAGLSVAARLRALGVKALLIDKNARVGDSWRKRYHQLVLHDPVWYDHMPYLPFPPTWPVFTPKDQIADFFESYAKLLELDVWTRTEIESSSWDDDEKKWTISLTKQSELKGLEPQTTTIHPRHVIQATGHSGKKNMPNIWGMDDFQGDLLCHSSDFPGARVQPPGKSDGESKMDGGKRRRAVVVGSCNSGHDIAQDYAEKGYDVTMVQRSSTCVISSKCITEVGLKGLYEEDGPAVEDADLWLHSIPAPLFKTHQQAITRIQISRDRKILEGLQRRGFKIDMGPSRAGLFVKYFQRGGGYYIDVGASQLIVDGKIKIKQGLDIIRVLPRGLRFADGSEIDDVDEIVFATGYLNMRSEARAIFGDELADRVKDVWGYDEKGEIRTIWKPSGHPGFWFMGGNLALCRYFSRLLALQIKAIEVGLKER